VAAIYFIKSAELNIGQAGWQQLWLALAAAGTGVLLAYFPSLSAWLLLWIPLAFYSLSLAYGGVPIFMPVWPPFSYYNVRYGLQLLPAIAVFSAVLLFFAMIRLQSRHWHAAANVTAFALVAASCVFVWLAQPICLQEAIANSRTRIPFEHALAKQLEHLPKHSTVLMYLGDHGGALAEAGIPLRRIIHESNHGNPKIWGKEGMWQRALHDPARYSDFAVGFDHDQVSDSARQHQLEALAVIETSGQPAATIYASHPRPQ
jgi:hypothetical protein